MGIPEAAIEDIRAKTRASAGNESMVFALVAVAIEGAQIAEPHIARQAQVALLRELLAYAASIGEYADDYRDQRNPLVWAEERLHKLEAGGGQMEEVRGDDG